MELPDAYATGLAQTRWPGRAEVVADVPSEQGGADNLVFCLDGAHTGESAATCADWFAEIAPQQSIRMLMFNCQRVSARRRIRCAARAHLTHPAAGARAQASADASRLRLGGARCVCRPCTASASHPCSVPAGLLFSHAVFVPPGPLVAGQPVDGATKVDLSWQGVLRQNWEEVQAERAASTGAARSLAQSQVVESPAAALAALRRLAREAQPARVQVLVRLLPPHAPFVAAHLADACAALRSPARCT